MRFSPVIYMFTILSKLPQKGCHWCDDCTNTEPNAILNNSQYQETKLKTKPNTIPSNTKQYTIPNQTQYQAQYQAIPNSTQYPIQAQRQTKSKTKQYQAIHNTNQTQHQAIPNSIFRFGFALRAVHQRVVWMHGLVIQRISIVERCTWQIFQILQILQI